MAVLRNSFKKIKTRRVLEIIVVLFVYFISGKFGLSLAFENSSATAIWPPTGIALAAFLLFGYRIFPAIFLGAFFVNFTNTGSLATSLGIAVGNMWEGFTGAYLINRFCGGLNVFDKPQNIFKFAFLVVSFSTIISATIGTLSLLLSGFLASTDYQETWLTWWLGDIGGALIFAPIIILWATKRHFLLRKGKFFEAILLLMALIVVGEVVFGSVLPFPYLLPYLCMPVMMWIVLRRTQTETITAVFIVFIIVTMNTLQRMGPFAAAGVTISQSLHLSQLFLATISIMMLAVSAIVTDRKKTEAIQERLATIVNSSEDAIYSMTLKGIVTTWNRGAVKIFDYSAKEMIGKSIESIFPPNRKDELKHIIATVKKGKHITAYESERVKKDGTVVPVSVAVSPLKDVHGNTVEISKIVRDISREKELEKRKDEFISMASHELNTPITGLSIYAQTLAKRFEKKGDKEAVEYLLKMDGQIKRIRHIIRDLLDTSKIRLGILSFTYSKFNLTNVVKEIAEVVQYMSKKHQLIIKGRISGKVKGDRDRIGQVLINLLSNARKYSPGGGKIIIQLRVHKKEAIVSVQDFGIGIAKTHQKRVFELFYRVQEYQGRNFPGMGIGLYLSFQIIHEHKGRMWFTSRQGKGTTFFFALPLEKNDK